MGRGNKLTQEECGKIIAYNDVGLTISAISLKIERSHNVIRNFLLNKDRYGLTAHTGRPCSLSPRQKKAIIKYSTNKSITSNEVKAHFDLKVSPDTILRVLNNDGKLKRRKYIRKPLLTDLHKAARIEFCRYNMDRGENWKNIVFSDEKKFNLDGPDGYEYYWSALGSSSQYLTRKCHD
ncbi:hypothetical protein ENBRE01_3410, partial [Enteropsectra breve]